MNRFFAILFIFIAILLHSNSWSQVTLSTSVTQNYICNGVGCNYSGPSILINEVMLCPTQFDGSIFGNGPGFPVNTNSGEWIELYNPDYCYPKDISGFLLGNNAPETGVNYGGGFVIPPNTIVPSRGFCVIRGANATPVPAALLIQNGGNTIEIIVNSSNSCIGGGNRLWFPNSGGWFAFYDKLGNPQDAISWSSISNSCNSCIPCVPPSSLFVGSLPSYDEIPALFKNYISADLPTIGMTFKRFPDGGAWQVSAPGSPTLGDCNGPCVLPSVVSCNGTASVVASGGNPPYSYFWSGGSSPINSVDTGLCAGIYSVTVTDFSGITATASVTVPNWVPNSSFTLDPDTFCMNNSAAVNYTGDASSVGNFAWTYTDAVLTSGIGAGPHSVTSSLQGTHQLSLVVIQNGCQSPPTQHHFFIYSIGADISIVQSPLCYQSATGKLTSFGNNGVLPYTYLWSNNIALPDNQNILAGNYSVTVTDFIGCTASVNFSLPDKSPMLVNITSIPESCFNVCDGQASVVVSGSTPPYTYQWQNNSSINPSASGYCSGNYVLMVTDSNLCTSSSDFFIPHAEIVSSLAVASPNVGIAPADIQFWYNGMGANIFYWDFGDGQNSTLMNPVHQYADPGIYTVSLIVNNGAPNFCTDSTTIQVEILPPSEVTIPNVFTPNGDGYNDTFSAVSIGIESESIKIFNRWGREVFYSNQVSAAWDGRDGHGNMLSDGIFYYVYIAKGFDKKEYNYHGSVSLLR